MCCLWQCLSPVLTLRKSYRMFPEKLTFDKYEIACFEPSTKKDPVDTLFVSPMAAVSDFDVTIRRQVLSDGVFKGTYEYVPCSEVGVTVSNKRLFCRAKRRFKHADLKPFFDSTGQYGL